MPLTVFVEPGPGGFRATTAGPPPLTADGPSPDAAVAAVQAQYAARVRAGGHLRTVPVGTADDLIAAAAAVGDNPLFDDFQAAIEDYRREHNTVPDAD